VDKLVAGLLGVSHCSGVAGGKRSSSAEGNLSDPQSINISRAAMQGPRLWARNIRLKVPFSSFIALLGWRTRVLTERTPESASPQPQ
jgi:hypothetical protein